MVGVYISNYLGVSSVKVGGAQTMRGGAIQECTSDEGR